MEARSWDTKHLCQRTTAATPFAIRVVQHSLDSKAAKVTT